MRHSISRILSISLALLFCFATNGQATQKTFPAGTYIIPMDSVNQPSADGGIFEAYGLVFDLLENGYTVYWMIDETKTSITAADFSIDGAGSAPVTVFNGAIGSGSIAGSTIQYSGAPFVVEPVAGVTDVLGHADWGAVDIHIASVPFTGNVSRKLEGAPPKVALLNNSESLASGAGNAAILEGYLRLAGICPSAYDIVTPNMVRDGIMQGTPVTFGGATYQQDYNILWTPHFTAYDGKYPLADMETLIQNVRTFVEAGNALFAECASISVFEHSPNGHFLTTTGISHDGGTMDPARIIYHDTTSPFPQVGDFVYTPEGGHLHNWRPWNSANYPPANTNTSYYDANKGKWVPTPEDYAFGPAYTVIPNGVPTVASQYNPTVSRFTYDDWDMNLATTNDQWDYYTGGRLDGNDGYGYVIYLGGHSYNNKCGSKKGKGGGGGGGSSVITGDLLWEFQFKKSLSNEDFTFDIAYTPAGGAQQTITLPNVSSASHAVSAGTDLVVDFTPATFNGKSIQNVSVKDTSAVDITVDSITVSWVNGNSSQKTKKLIDTTDNNFNLYNSQKTSGNTFTPPNDGDGTYTIVATTSPPPGGGGTIGGCVDNAACGLKNPGDEAGVRYVLNTLFNLQFALVDVTYTRSSPIILGDYMYQGAFATPSYKGHMYIYDTTTNPMNVADELWARDQMPASRTMYTTPDGTNGSQILFNTANLGSFAAKLGLGAYDPANNTAFTTVVDRVRGEGLMAIEHSAATVVMPSTRNPQTPPRTMLYFGTLGGELEAFDVSSLYGGTGAITELWSFIPMGQLAALQNPRTANPPISPHPGVDGSPTVAEIYIPNASPTIPGTWKTVLTVLPGAYGAQSTILALDITNPASPKVMFEKQGTDPATGVVTMGRGYRSAIGTLKDTSGAKTNVVFVVTNKLMNPNDKGGLHVFAFDLANGTQLWDRPFNYLNTTQNDIPGAITLLDDTNDGYVDKVILGDMEGKIWVLNAADGSIIGPPSDPTGPLYDAGVGFPISASPTVVFDNVHNRYVVLFGTGGTNWTCSPISASPCANIYSIIAVDMGTGLELWKDDLAPGEKVWGSPTVSNGYVYVNTAFGDMENADPGATGATQMGNLKTISLGDGTVVDSVSTGNQRGSVYVKDGKAYVTDINSVTSVQDVQPAGTPISVDTVSWRQN